MARAPSKECGRCLLTKLGLAQFTAGLFWRLGEQWHPAVNIFDALSPHTIAASYTRPIHTTRHNALSRNTRATQQSRRAKWAKIRRLCLSAPDDGMRQRIVGAVEPESIRRAHSSPVRPRHHTPARSWCLPGAVAREQFFDRPRRREARSFARREKLYSHGFF